MQAVAEAHGTELAVRSRPAGGLEVEVAFPAASTARAGGAAAHAFSHAGP